MTLQTIGEGISTFGVSIYQVSTSTAIWLGNTIQIGFTNYLVPAVSAIWSAMLPCLAQTSKAILAGQCPPLLLAGICFVVGVIVFKISSRQEYEENTCCMKFGAFFGIINLIACVIFTSFAISAFL